MNKNELSAQTKDEQRTAAESGTSASVAANPVLSAALSVEGDKLIAEFMKINVTDFNWKEHLGLVHCDEYGDFQIDEDLQFYSPRTNWNDLMPVVEKIEEYETPNYYNSDLCTTEDFTCSFDIGSEGSTITVFFKQPDSSKQRKYKQFNQHQTATKIEAVWLAVVEFIKWYNDNAVLAGSR